MLRATLCSLPPTGVFFTAKALFARFAAAARFPSNVIASAVLFTVALETATGPNPKPWTAICREILLLLHAPPALDREWEPSPMLQPDAAPESSASDAVIRTWVLAVPLITSTTTWYFVLGERSMPSPGAVNRASPHEPGRLDGFVSVPSLAPGLPEEWSEWMLTA